jgi:hypothetical protein
LVSDSHFRGSAKFFTDKVRVWMPSFRMAANRLTAAPRWIRHRHFDLTKDKAG